MRRRAPQPPATRPDPPRAPTPPAVLGTHLPSASWNPAGCIPPPGAPPRAPGPGHVLPSTSDEEGRDPLAAPFFPGGLSAGLVRGSSASGERLSVDPSLGLAPEEPRALASSPATHARPVSRVLLLRLEPRVPAPPRPAGAGAALRLSEHRPRRPRGAAGRPAAPRPAPTAGPRSFTFPRLGFAFGKSHREPTAPAGSARPGPALRTPAARGPHRGSRGRAARVATATPPPRDPRRALARAAARRK